MKNSEITSKRVASIAGRLQRKLAKAAKQGAKFLFCSEGTTILISEVQSVLGSVLTQAADKKTARTRIPFTDNFVKAKGKK